MATTDGSEHFLAQRQARPSRDRGGARPPRKPSTNSEEFAEKWDARCPSIAKSWRANRARIIPMFGLPEDIRRAVYTTNAIESIKMSLHKVIKTRASFPSDEAAFKLPYLAPARHREKVDHPHPTLESGDAGFCHHLCRPRPDAERKFVYTK